ncbi:sensor histidine kinase [Flavisphingomonas formosensis]|uniref:sensor histidine kinase n=1 Tax=Flavisphingomonas formosensis TaxID=861534 RepID=UPI0012FC0B2B|nr:PAS domain-containing sensor histidine kinase [Sphingomonas formosensis]
MTALDGTTGALVAIFLALWTAAAVIAVVFGLRRAMYARGAAQEALRLSALLGCAPAASAMVGSDGKMEADGRLADWLGLARAPRVLTDLAGPAFGLVDDDAAALSREVSTAQRSGRAFTRPVHIQNSDRVLMVRGRLAPQAELGAGIVLLWFFDVTDMQAEMADLRGEKARLARALDAISRVIEEAPFPIWHRGPDLRLSLVNRSYVDAVEGQSAADVIARGLELVEAIDGRTPLATAAEARERGHGEIHTVPATIRGERRMIRIADVPLGGAGVAGYAVDVEDLEVARSDLNRFARAQRDMLDRLSAGVAQFAADRGLVFSNDAFHRLFALKPEWLGDRPEFDRVLERMRETGRIPESRDFPSWKAERRGWFTATSNAMEENWLLPGGLHLRVVAQPLPDGGLLLIFEDRTEQVQLASARDTLLRVRTATFDNLFEAVGVFAADGRLHLWNNRFRDVWNFEEEELAAHPRVDALVEVVAKKLANPSRASIIRELVRIATVDRQQRGGRVALTDGRHFEFAVVPLPDGNALFTMLDITDSRRIEAALRERTDALEEADRVKTAFLANMSYELRTPLTSIGGFAEMLSGGYGGPLDDRAKDYVDLILQASARLGALIDDILDLTQSEAGALPMAEEKVDLTALVSEAGQEAGDRARAKPLDLVVDIAKSVGTLVGDSRRLRQSVDHLLRNAIAYTPAGGRVLLCAEGDKQEARIIVSDNGPGIDPRQRDRAFDRFHRVSPEEDSHRAALGLGLPLTRQFVAAHGGTLDLQSKPGVGTTAIIRLPRKRSA